MADAASVRSTVYLAPELHQALREDQEDLAAVRSRARERPMVYEDFLAKLKSDVERVLERMAFVALRRARRRGWAAHWGFGRIRKSRKTYRSAGVGYRWNLCRPRRKCAFGFGYNGVPATKQTE